MAWIYERSLGLTLALLLGASFVLHWWFSLVAANEEAARHGGQPGSFLEYLGDPQLWFESAFAVAVDDRLPVVGITSMTMRSGRSCRASALRTKCMRSQVAMFAEREFDRAARAADGAVLIHPSTGLHIGL
ncbi:hypothetical protein CHELA1G11_21678 [Hyphomicrobiales bacterium]|nr:hypothetical protein CHELA1G11_21678 [Hyphomicrobiales bacterium]CAH1695431.1 hypothetical protein CHELA1G2_21983 [Hyphomicrobiales bacterium]